MRVMIVSLAFYFLTWRLGVLGGSPSPLSAYIALPPDSGEATEPGHAKHHHRQTLRPRSPASREPLAAPPLPLSPAHAPQTIRRRESRLPPRRAPHPIPRRRAWHSSHPQSLPRRR